METLECQEIHQDWIDWDGFVNLLRYLDHLEAEVSAL